MKNKILFLVGAGFAALSGLPAPSTGTGNLITYERSTPPKQIAPETKKKIARLTNGDGSPRDIGKWAGGNQRQQRKRWRQSPTTRPAKNRR